MGGIKDEKQIWFNSFWMIFTCVLGHFQFPCNNNMKKEKKKSTFKETDLENCNDVCRSLLECADVNKNKNNDYTSNFLRPKIINVISIFPRRWTQPVVAINFLYLKLCVNNKIAQKPVLIKYKIERNKMWNEREEEKQTTKYKTLKLIKIKRKNYNKQ